MIVGDNCTFKAIRYIKVVLFFYDKEPKQRTEYSQFGVV